MNFVKCFEYAKKIGFSDVGLKDKWEFINAKTKNDTFIIEYYKTEFDVNKDSFEPDKTRVEFYDGKDYYDINMIEIKETGEILTSLEPSPIIEN